MAICFFSRSFDSRKVSKTKPRRLQVNEQNNLNEPKENRLCEHKAGMSRPKRKCDQYNIRNKCAFTQKKFFGILYTADYGHFRRHFTNSIVIFWVSKVFWCFCFSMHFGDPFTPQALSMRVFADILFRIFWNSSRFISLLFHWCKMR